MTEFKLKPCPFCGSENYVRSVDGGVLPSYINEDVQDEILEKTPYVVSCEIICESCGARVEGYAVSDKSGDDLYSKAIEDCYTKWNRRA